MTILNCYDALGRGDIQKASAEYTAGTLAYTNFASEYGNDSSIHAEFKQLHADIAIQMR